MSGRFLARFADERGATLIIVMAWMTLIVLMAAFVVDVANWFEHKRHLQVQADAAALAGGNTYAYPLCSDLTIEAATRDYGGSHVDGPSPTTYSTAKNNQIGGTATSNVRLLINADKYFNQGGVSFTDGGGDHHPCAAKMVDVKLTEEPSSVLGSFIPKLLPTINAHARVQIRRLDISAQTLPIGVPNPQPKSAAVVFWDETSGSKTVLASRPLVQTGVSSGGTDWGSAGASVPISSSKIGVTIALSGANTLNTTGNIDLICGRVLVECYDTNLTNGVVFIRGYNPSASGQQYANNPVAKDVFLKTGSCLDPYFSEPSGSCAVEVNAQLDFGTTYYPPIEGPVSANDITVTANGVTLTPPADLQLGYWKGSIPVSPLSAGIPVTINWQVRKGHIGGTGNSNDCSRGNGCSGSFGAVQRTYTAVEDNSGPLDQVQVFDCTAAGSCVGALTPSKNSFPNGANPLLGVRIHIKGALQNVEVDPVTGALSNVQRVYLRIIGKGSQTQALDCDPDITQFSDEIAQGCKPQYEVNTGTPDCVNDINKTTLWGSPQPWTCIAIKTGNRTQEVAQGLNARILGDERASTCTAPNNWSKYGTPAWSWSDPRIVFTFLTPYGSFNGSGNSTTVPVTDWGTFYVTGWTTSGGGFNNPCQGAGDDPAPNGGTIVGHFIHYSAPTGAGTGTAPCDFTAFAPCIAVMTD